MYRLIESDGENDAAFDCAEWLLALLKTRLWQQENVTLFVSGGTSPAAVFDQLSTFDIPWQKVNVHLVDERWAHKNPADQNATLVKQHLLQKKAASAAFQPLLLDKDFTRNLHACNEQVGSIQQPDIVLLGLGLDGHIASLFPDAPDYRAAMTTADHYTATHPSQAPHARITMGFNWITAATQIVLFIPGKEKRTLFNQIAKKSEPESPLRNLIRESSHKLTVITTRIPRK